MCLIGFRRFMKTALLLMVAFTLPALSFTYSGVSWLGGSADTDMAVATSILSDGKIVVAANISTAQPGAKNPTLLNNATAESSGAVLILDKTGTQVLSVTRVAPQLLDIALDGSENIYLAAANDGILKLNSSATELLFKKECGGYCFRIDAADDGTVAGLNASGSNAGTIYVYDKAGTELGNFAGYRYTQDLAVSSTHKLVYFLGFRNANTAANPVQISYIRAKTYQGEIAWTNYDWPANLMDNSDGVPYGTVKPENNMADSRGYRISIGEDGFLYAAFEIAGGNHLFRYDPKDLMKKVTVVGGDMWHNFYNTHSEHKVFFARYNGANGDYILGQQFCTRYWNEEKQRFDGNAARVNEGNITADKQGRVYLVGPSASGLPIPGAQGYTEKEGQAAYNPFDPKCYTGGAYILLMSPDLKTRLYCTRLSGGSTRGVATKTVNGITTVAWVGQAGTLGTDFKSNPTWLLDTHNPVQPQPGGGTKEGFFAVMTVDLSATTGIRPIQILIPAYHKSKITTRSFIFNGITEASSSPQFLYNLNGRSIKASSRKVASSLCIGVTTSETTNK